MYLGIATSLGENLEGTMIQGIRETMTETEGLVGLEGQKETEILIGINPGRGLEVDMIQSSTEGLLRHTTEIMTEEETVDDQNTTEDRLPRPPYDRDRDRDRSYPPPRYDRPPTERGYDRDRYPRDTSPPNWRRSSPPRGYRRDSRSPPRLSRRRSRSPPPSLYRRPSRSPPPKRLRLGNHSIGSPHSSRSSPHRRYRSPSPRRDGRRRSPSLDRQSRRHSPPPPPPPRPSSRSSRHSQLEQGEHRSDSRPPEIKGPGVTKEQERDNQERHRSRSRSPRREQQVPSPAPKPQTTTSLSVNAGSGQTEPSQSASPLSSINSHSTPPQDMPKRASPAVPALPMISTDPWASPHPKDPSRPSTPAEQATHLPPRQPRNYRGRGDFRGGLRGTFRGLEPPRGPRNRGPSAVGATTPMSGSHPSPSPVSAPGLPGKDSLPSTPSQPVLVPTTLTGEVYVDSWESLVQQHIPQLVDLEHSYKNSMRQLDMMNKEYASIQKDYKSIYRVARRALHEFDMSAIDLRAAEARRRVTSQQHELARLGRLGVDAGTASLDVY
ncbi:hypothetical protein VNI00_005886 [Paramarasmius palmivorus]|uniref:Uncharacterized protein n=1 Tax=Paramarasmius palmivorus TaxID=297713 RepID=A0AAW0DAM5_9AGAR